MYRLSIANVLFCLVMAGCLALGPDYKRPAVVLDMPPAYWEAGDVETRQYAVDDLWWAAFEDPRLNKVVANVIAHNPDIQKAAASVMQARAVAGQTKADRFPSLGLEGKRTRQGVSSLDSTTGQVVTVETDGFSLALPASFEIDLWGRLARASEAARADLLAAESNQRTIVQSLVAEAAAQYFNIRSLEEQLDIARQVTATYRENLELVEARYRRGLASILDVRQARRILAQSEANIPTLVQTVGIARQALAVMQGKYPERTRRAISEADTAGLNQNKFTLPPPVPTGLPSDLLNRRPDIQVAEAALAAACARIGVAKANRFPQISLTGSFGYASDELDLLLEPESELWRVAAGIFQSIFDAGKRKAAQRAAEAKYQQQLAAYAKTILQAFADVEGALLTRKQQVARYERLMIFLEEATATLDTAMDRYQRGLSTYLNVFDAQQARFQAELSLVKTRYAIYSNRVALYRSLGGGWGTFTKEKTNDE